jgi:hypothetical protein
LGTRCFEAAHCGAQRALTLTLPELSHIFER